MAAIHHFYKGCRQLRVGLRPNVHSGSQELLWPFHLFILQLADLSQRLPKLELIKKCIAVRTGPVVARSIFFKRQMHFIPFQKGLNYHETSAKCCCF